MLDGSKAAAVYASACEIVPHEPDPNERLRSIGWILQQVEEQRQHAQRLKLDHVEELLDSAVTELTAIWARSRKQNREGPQCLAR